MEPQGGKRDISQPGITDAFDNGAIGLRRGVSSPDHRGTNTLSGFTFDDKILNNFNIIGLLIGGSSAYSLTQAPSRDWDGLIVVKDYSSVVSLLSSTSVLSSLLGVVVPTDPLWWTNTCSLKVDLEAVRFCGLTSSGLKKSVKIIAGNRIKTLLEDKNPRAIRILSQKDVRLYSSSYLGHRTWRVQPVTTLSDRLFVLHDADIYLSPRDRNGHIYASFGCTMDLLLTGTWIYRTQAVEALSESAIQKYSSLEGVWIPEDWTTIFSRNSHFSIPFRDILRSRGGWGELLQPSLTPFNMPGSLFWLKGSTYIDNLMSYLKVKNISTPQDSSQDSSSDTLYPGLGDAEKWVVSADVISRFSGNCTAVRLSSLQSPQTSVFRKRTTQWESELCGATRMQMLGNRVHQPLLSDPVQEEIIYPWFDGESLSDLRLQYYGFEESSPQSCKLFEVIIQAEMRKAEDMLSLYCSTASQQQCQSNIQQFFCHRILDNRRIRELYPLGILTGGTRYDIEHLMSLPMRINGSSFPPLSTILQEALVKLAVNDVTVLGLGDGHGGNVLVGDRDESSAESLRYIDYEAAGRHSPWLDMAKPIYNDVFYNIFYADLLGRNLFATGTVQAVIREHSVDVFFAHLPDLLSNSMWQIRKRYLLGPFVKQMRNRGLKIDDWNKQLGLALLCCAVLMRSFREREDLFFANMALGVLLAHWNGLDDFRY